MKGQFVFFTFRNGLEALLQTIQLHLKVVLVFGLWFQPQESRWTQMQTDGGVQVGLFNLIYLGRCSLKKSLQYTQIHVAPIINLCVEGSKFSLKNAI